MERRTRPDLAIAVEVHDHARGSATAPVMLVEYGDYECPYTQKALLVVEALERELGERLRFVFRHFPRSVIHRHAQQAAEAAEAAHAQGHFWEMHRHLLEPQWNLDFQSLVHYAVELNLDGSRFERALRDHTFANRVQEDLLSGVASGVDATPGFFVNGMRYTGAVDLPRLRAACLQAEEQAQQRV